MGKFYVYILKSIKDNRKYTGFTSNLNKRLKDHNSGKVRSTRLHRPYIVIYKEEVSGRDEAVRREKCFKKGYMREILIA